MPCGACLFEVRNADEGAWSTYDGFSGPPNRQEACDQAWFQFCRFSCGACEHEDGSIGRPHRSDEPDYWPNPGAGSDPAAGTSLLQSTWKYVPRNFMQAQMEKRYGFSPASAFSPLKLRKMEAQMEQRKQELLQRREAVGRPDAAGGYEKISQSKQAAVNEFHWNCMEGKAPSPTDEAAWKGIVPGEPPSRKSYVMCDSQSFICPTGKGEAIATDSGFEGVKKISPSAARHPTVSFYDLPVLEGRH